MYTECPILTEKKNQKTKKNRHVNISANLQKQKQKTTEKPRGQKYWGTAIFRSLPRFSIGLDPQLASRCFKAVRNYRKSFKTASNVTLFIWEFFFFFFKAVSSLKTAGSGDPVTLKEIQRVKARSDMI